MKKNEGSLTIEATISLSVFIFFMMSIINFGQIYKAQVYIDHRLLQAGKMVSFMSYDYDNNNSVVETVFSFIEAFTHFSAGVESQWIVEKTKGSGDYSGCVSTVFHQLKGKNDFEDPDTIMSYYGIDNVEIKAIENSNDLDISAAYDIKLIFKFFGIEKVSMKQNVKCGLWK